MSKIAKRLYEQFRPEHYQLQLNIDRDKLTFKGTVTITGQKAGRPSKRLTFHQKRLKITSAKLHSEKRGEKQSVLIARINHQQKMYEVRLHSAELLYPGHYSVELEFEGKITPDMQGIYQCNFNHNDQAKKLIATQFESHHAREAFPCIDEPEAKATFQLTLDTESDSKVLSNTAVQQQKKRDQRLITTFEKTPKMSTYLLAFVYGEMHCLESKTKQGVVVRSWSTVAQDKALLKYSVDEAVRYLEFFTNYFRVPYPLAKCDQVALPDFDAGAMENWGLITYREIALLSDPDNPSISNEQYISMVIAHELSHQWFGNLVTMKWWDDLWLNESFASLMEHMAMDAVHPEWRQWEHYVASDVISTTSRDIYSDIQPVGVQVTDPDLIETLFDPGIVYAKGGRLLKMLREYMGEQAFQQGLKSYFKLHAYSNASRDDLWQALSEAHGSDLSSLMNAWIRQPGMPLVTATQSGNHLTLSQERFTLDKEPDGTVWPVPLLASQKLDPPLMTRRNVNYNLPSNDFILLNQSASGHYFVRYNQPEHREALNKRLQKQEIIPESRINVLNDAYLLARKGSSPLTDALDTIKRCAHEDRDSVWAAISRIISAAGQLTEGDEAVEKQLYALRIKLAHQWFEKLGWDDKPKDDPNTKQLRHTALAYMAIAEDQGIIKEALRRYDATKDLNKIQAELRGLILGIVVRFGKNSVVDDLLQAYPKATADVQLDIASALASTKDPEVAAHVYSKAMGEGGFVRTQDLLRWLAMFLRNYRVREFTWSWLVQHWNWLQKALSESKSYDFLPVYCAAPISSKEWQKKFVKLFGPLKSDKRLQRNISIGMADISAKVAWRKRDEADIKRWLKSF